MSDIETLLRSVASNIELDLSSGELMAAADEIERLRAENEKLREELERLKSIDFLTSAVRSGFLYDKVEDK